MVNRLNSERREPKSEVGKERTDASRTEEEPIYA
jgi:hypothetical protein